MQNSGIYRNLIIYSIIVPLAVFLGFLATDPGSFTGLIIIMAVLGVILSPLILRWHHLLAIISVNLFFNIFFLPGQPQAWAAMAIISLGITVVSWVINKRERLIWDPDLALPLIFLGIVIMLTAKLTGGIGARALGSDQSGGKRYMVLILGILIFFTISIKPINPKNARFIFAAFLLSGITAIISNLIFIAGPNVYFLFNFFPAELSSLAGDFSNIGLRRYNGFNSGAQFTILAMLAIYGLRGIFSMRFPWRIALFILLVMIGLLGGFRSFLVKLAFLCIIMMYLEQMFRFRYLFWLTQLSLLVYAGLVVFALYLPTSIQRAVSFLPFVEISTLIENDAQGTLDWRFEMWKTVLPDVPKYLILGKGFSFDGTDYALTQAAVRRQSLPAYEATLISGNYHNGILTMIIPFGIFGVIFFIWFLLVTWRRLLHYYRTGPPELQSINTFALAWFMQMTVHYFVFYGQFDLDIIKFTGLAALSVSINKGYALHKAKESQQSMAIVNQETKLLSEPKAGVPATAL